MVKGINAGRAANAKRLGERCLPLTFTEDEHVNILIDENESWPVEEDHKEEECPICPSSPKGEDLALRRSPLRLPRNARRGGAPSRRSASWNWSNCARL